MLEPVLCILVIFLVILVIAVCGMLHSSWHQQAFNERFPPISDEEFVARCRPGTNPTIALKVRAIVADQLGVEYARIYPSSRFVQDLGAD